MRKMSGVCDYFVIASGTSTTHVDAIADNIAKVMKAKGERLWHVEGRREASWILLDLSDVVAHIFLAQTRKFYNLEGLWSDAPQASFGESGIQRKPLKKIRGKKVPRKKIKKIKKIKKSKKKA